MHIEIYKYPAWYFFSAVYVLMTQQMSRDFEIFGYRDDVVEIETWCQSEGRIGTRRDWILKDVATGEVTGRATRFPFHHC